MLGRFMPKEGRFFDLFNNHAQELILGADALIAFLSALNRSPEAASVYAKEIDIIEGRADKINYETIALLHSTFITPLDRDEIHQLTTRLDDVVDTIQSAVRTMSIYDVRVATPEAIRFGEIIHASIACVVNAVNMLHNMNNGPAILAACREIDRYENEADDVLREAMSKLFREEQDVRELIKLKAIYGLLETVTDRCDHVGNLLEAIVLENS